MSEGLGTTRMSPVLATALAAFLVAATVVSAADVFYLPNSGGLWSTCGNWSTGACPGSDDVFIYASSGTLNKIVDLDANPQYILDGLHIGGLGARYGMLLQTGRSLITEWMTIGAANGEGWLWMENNAFLWVMGDLYVGHVMPGPGHVHLNGTDAGLLVGGTSFVGTYATGDFQHLAGQHTCDVLVVGCNETGQYWLSGSPETSGLTAQSYVHIGGPGISILEQNGGTFTIGPSDDVNFLTIGWGTEGTGKYVLKNGIFEAEGIHIGDASEGFLEQSGGTLTTTSVINIGGTGQHTETSIYSLTEDDGPAALEGGTELRIGLHYPGRFDQDAGTATIGEEIEIGGDGELFLDGGSLECPTVINGGIIAQTGGDFEAWELTNDTALGVNLSEGDFRVRYLTNTMGFVQSWDGSLLRGSYAGGGYYYLCEFENFSEFAMGSGTFDGGEFRGVLTNHGQFNYYSGDFSAGTLINYGTFARDGDFSCYRLLSHADLDVTPGHGITADGASHSYAIENHAQLTVHPGATLSLIGGKPLLNEGEIYAGAILGQTTTIAGDVVNKGFLALSHNNGTGNLNVNGDYSASSDAELRIRMRGTAWATEHDRLTIQAHAALSGALDVNLMDGFLPALGDRFGILRFATRTGDFGAVNLPSLPAGRGWRLNYWANGLTLVVAAPGDFEGDGDIDLDDYAFFADCMNGPGRTPHPVQTNVRTCLAAFDSDTDGDVDMVDAAAFTADLGN